MRALLLALALAGCGDHSRELRFTERPADLADCSFHELTNSRFEIVVVVRCPMSSTTTRSGKRFAAVVEQ